MSSGADRVDWLRGMIATFTKELASLDPLPTEAEVLAVTTSDYSRGYSEGYACGFTDGKTEGYIRAEGRLSRGRR